MDKRQHVKHVCMIVYTNYSTDARVRREAETLAALPEYRVTVLVNKQNDKPGNFVLEKVKIVEINVPTYRGRSQLSYSYSYLHFILLAFLTCSKIFFQESIDIVHIHNMPNILVIAALIPRLFGKKIILDVHDNMLELYKCKFGAVTQNLKTYVISQILKIEEYFSCAIAHKVITVNEIQKNILLGRGVKHSKLAVLLNVPDPKIFPYGSNVRRGGSEHFNLVYFGTITNRLGIDLAILSIAGLLDAIPEIKLFIIGDGEQKDELKLLANELNVSSAIHFSQGAIPLDRLCESLKEMDLAIIPNRRNDATEMMLPVKLLESIAIGIPVVTPELKAIKYYFNEEMVFFFEPDDVSSLQSAILKAYKDPSLRFRKRDKARSFLDLYGWDTHKFDLYRLYSSLYSK